VRELVLSAPEAAIREVMQPDFVTVDPLKPQREVARMVAKYNLLAIPVVSVDNALQGIVTVDDAIDAIIPTAWKKRLPRIF